MPPKRKVGRPAGSKNKPKSANCRYAWMFVCKYPRCKAMFASSDTLRTHERSIHLKLKPYQCTWKNCNYRASIRHNVIMHIRSNHFGTERTIKGQLDHSGGCDERDPLKYLKVIQKLLDFEKKSRKGVKNKAELVKIDDIAKRGRRLIWTSKARVPKRTVDPEYESSEASELEEDEPNGSESDASKSDELEPDESDFFESESRPEPETVSEPSFQPEAAYALEPEPEPEPEPDNLVREYLPSDDAFYDDMDIPDSTSAPNWEHGPGAITMECNCDITFTTEQEMITHRRIHSFIGPYYCKWPGCLAPNNFYYAQLRHVCLAHLRSPVMKDNPEQTKYVGFCSFVLKEHREQMSTLEYTLRVVSDTQGTEDDLMQNVTRSKSFTRPLPYKCKYPDCPYSFRTRIHIYYHIGMKHLKFASTFIDQFGTAYIDRLDLIAFVNRFNQHVSKPPEAPQPSPTRLTLNFPQLDQYKCHHCGEGFDQLNVLRAHLRAENEIYPFVCKWEQCDQAYHSITKLAQHIQLDHVDESNLTGPIPNDPDNPTKSVEIKRELLNDNLIYESLCLCYTNGLSDRFIVGILGTESNSQDTTN